MFEPQHHRDLLLGLCHFVRETRWEPMLNQAVRLLMDLENADSAVLFLTNASGQGAQLVRTVSRGDVYAANQRLELSFAEDRCPLAQVARTGELLRFERMARGYDFGRVWPVLERSPEAQNMAFMPLRNTAQDGLIGIALVQGLPTHQSDNRAIGQMLRQTIADRLAECRLNLRRSQETEQMSKRLRAIEQERQERRRDQSFLLAQRLVGDSPVMRRLRERLPDLAKDRRRVLMLGFDGSGKEFAARELHALSPRSNGRFIYVNCASFRAEGLIPELFGYKRGAIVGQAAARRGLLREAAGGTLYLDRADALSEEMQHVILRLLETNSYRSLGSERDHPLDARIIFGARPSLSDDVQTGSFLPSLFYMIKPLSLHVPGLAERRSDIPEIARDIVARHYEDRAVPPALSPEAGAQLMAMEYRSDLRELTALVKAALEYVDADQLFLLPDHIDAARGSLEADGPFAAKTLETGLKNAVEAFEAELIRQALSRAGGNRAFAARDLYIPKRTLADKCKKYMLS